MSNEIKLSILDKIFDFLTWLDGKKTFFLSVSSALNSVLLAFQVYDVDAGLKIQMLLSVLFGGAKAASDKMGVGK